MDIILRTNDKNKVLQLKNIRLFKDYGHAELYAYSEGFSVEQRFYFENYAEFISDLKKMNIALQGEASLKQNYEEDYIKFIADKKGHILVEVEMSWHSEFPHKIHNTFQTDQTVLSPFIADLEKTLID